MFTLDNLQGAPGSAKRKTRKGRGIAAGQGHQCGFGMRGQKSRGGRPVKLTPRKKACTNMRRIETTIMRI